MTLDEALEKFRAAANAMARGDADKVKAMYSERADVTLANPFGHAVCGRADVDAALDYVSSRFRDGEVTEFRTIARYETADLATFLDVEHWRTRVGGADELSEFDLRVSSTYRREDDEWRLVHRHADPITTFDESGPVRRTT
jgi:ketosteroid isomerase-like protein